MSAVGIGFIVGILIGLLAVWVALLVLLWLFRPRGVPLREALRIVPDLLRLVRSLVTDKQAPVGVRAALVFLLVWLVNPIDLIPEFVPVIGPLDDVVVAVLVLRYVRRRIGEDELRRLWPGTDAGYALLESILR
ncbi:MAG TPA: YkvA family protein [Candidatus Dormibacteraeota bacterium]|nr:YkvA family protein [Candidatus Dormibacteraeota bacterium]